MPKLDEGSPCRWKSPRDIHKTKAEDGERIRAYIRGAKTQDYANEGERAQDDAKPFDVLIAHAYPILLIRLSAVPADEQLG